MKSTLVTASILALATLSAGASFAEGRGGYSQDNTSVVSAAGSKTRAEVQADLAQAQRDGFSVNLGDNWSGNQAAPVGQKTRAEVRAEAITSASAKPAFENVNN